MARPNLTVVAAPARPRLTVITGGGQTTPLTPAQRLARKRALALINTDAAAAPATAASLTDELAYGQRVDDGLATVSANAHLLADDATLRDLLSMLACALAGQTVEAQRARAQALILACLPGQPDPTADAADEAALIVALADMIECELLAHLTCEGPLDEAAARALALDAYGPVLVDQVAQACDAAGDDLLDALIGRRRVRRLNPANRLVVGDWRVLLSDFLPRPASSRRPDRGALADRLWRMLAAA
jgi:hypothetical protein